MWHWPIGKYLDLSFIWGHHHLHAVGLWIWADQLSTSQLATPCWRDPTRSKQLSTVSIWLSVWTLSCRCPLKLSTKYQPCIITGLYFTWYYGDEIWLQVFTKKQKIKLCLSNVIGVVELLDMRVVLSSIVLQLYWYSFELEKPGNDLLAYCSCRPCNESFICSQLPALSWLSLEFSPARYNFE